MLCEVRSLGLSGISGYEVRAECDLSAGLPAFEIVGLPDAAVKEARDRVRAAIKNCGFTFPVSRITVNLAPANQRQGGHGVRFAHSGGYSGRRGTAQAGRAGQRLRGGAVFVRLPAAGGGHAAHGPGRPGGRASSGCTSPPPPPPRPLWPAGWRSTRWRAWGSWRPI